MVPAMRFPVFLALLCCLVINIVVAEPRIGRLQKRQDTSEESTATIPPLRTTLGDASTIITSKPSTTGEGRSEDGNLSSRTEGQKSKQESSITSDQELRSKSTTEIFTSATPTEVPVTSAPSNINGPAETISYNLAQYNYTATPELLPILPEITPGFAVGGVLLMLTGVVYTLIGIKNKWLHIFFSVTYLASVSVTVLILYVMNPPVSNAIQGAYLVAVVMTGLILGAAATVFSEMTEGLGCLLGGFCFSMWLLVLKPGGLITSTGGKSIFIACFTIAAFATSFSRYTRDHGLIVGISFGGATAVVLGIDCFSRAGLKEFWAYIWDLNTNLFPVGATSYPLTRGMKVEIAAIIILFLAGIVSQMKLWKVIKERREQRAAERLQDERTMEQEEENVGRRIEHRNARERDQWEAVYGDKDTVINNANSSTRDSGVGDMDSQKKGPRSIVTSVRQSGEEEIEMSQMASPTLTTGAGLVMMNNGQEGGPVTVRVARDTEPLSDIDENATANPSQQPDRRSHISARSARAEPVEEEKVWVVGGDGEARMERQPSQRNSKRVSNPQASEAPKVVPLPFSPPMPSAEGEAEDDRSSVATFADEEEVIRKRRSRNLSAGAEIIRKLSKRSGKDVDRNSRSFSRGEGPSTDDLVIPRAVEVEDDRASSVAATMDGLSDDEDLRSIRSSFDKAPDTDEARTPAIPQEGASKPTLMVVTDGPEGVSSRPLSEATEATNILDPETTIGESTVKQSLTSSTDPKSKATPSPAPENEPQDASAEKNDATPTVVSAIESKATSITKERLPPQLSKVVMSYRTNEWAKHLSTAETPEVEELQIAEYPAESEAKASEIAAPVNVEELQQTAENGAPPPASRPVSSMSNQPAPLSRSGSTLGVQTPYQRPSTSTGVPQDTTIPRSISQPTLRPLSQHGARAPGFRSSSSPLIPQPIVESPIEDSSSTSPNFPLSSTFTPTQMPFGSTSTLMGRRDSMLRNKVSSPYFGNGSALASTPEFPSPYHHSTGPNSDTGSVYNYSTPILAAEDDNISLTARRSIIRQSSTNLANPHTTPGLQGFDSHQPRRQSSAPSPAAREQQLASWRANVAQDLGSNVIPKSTIERSRSALLMERQAEEMRREGERRRKGERDSAFDERMRRGDMLDAHREALRRMQAAANVNA